MNRVRANSSPELVPSTDDLKHQDGSPLEGASANVKLLLKMIQDHHDSTRDDDGRKPQLVAGMITILDNVRARIEKSQLAPKPRILQRCNTDVRRTAGGAGAGIPPRRPQDSVSEENHRLRRELSASIAAQKSLEKMFLSLGKEKEIIAAELARKVQELDEMEELVGDLRAQNQMLTEKVKTCAAEHKSGAARTGGDSPANAALQERNKVLSEQLLMSLDGYRSMKRKLKDAQEEKTRLQMKVAEAAEGVAAGVMRMRGACERLCRGKEGPKEVGEMLVFCERVLVGLQAKLSKGSASS